MRKWLNPRIRLQIWPFLLPGLVLQVVCAKTYGGIRGSRISLVPTISQLGLEDKIGQVEVFAAVARRLKGSIGNE